MQLYFKFEQKRPFRRKYVVPYLRKYLLLTNKGSCLRYGGYKRFQGSEKYYTFGNFTSTTANARTKFINKLIINVHNYQRVVPSVLRGHGDGTQI